MFPRVSGCVPTRSPAFVFRYDTPARQLALAPMSPPACTKALHAPMPLLLRSLPGNASTVADLGAELEEQVGGRHPFDLHAVLRELASEKRLIGERRILEVPCVLMLLVQVADPGEEASELRHEAIRHAVATP